ncbi:MAG TPA: hypothetical protein VKR21_04620 [Solirubrobacteraceae bacterium]|nr:hypothetical protein [Solirubrobacteraceae bacterium]
MGGHRLKPGAWFVGVSVCLFAAGCGSTQTITKTTTVVQTKTVTRTVVHHTGAPRTKTVTVASLAPPGGGSGYPSVFTSRFNTACANSGIYTPGFCRCARSYIEAHVPFSTVRAEGQAAFGDSPPKWFVTAQNHCAGQ